MLKRITRYALLITCLLLAGAWGWSYAKVEELIYDGDDILVIFTVSQGKAEVFQAKLLRTVFPIQFHSSSPIHQNVKWLGFRYTSTYTQDTYAKHLVLPLWMPFALFSLLALGMWYRPIRNRLRGKRDAGFAVEMKEPQPVKE
ncbi:MAG: hypothetical protein H7144_17170 [Burkholderiales bacterium]|nr:hypothetical protein [Phycisphaerae bacterium]